MSRRVHQYSINQRTHRISHFPKHLGSLCGHGSSKRRHRCEDNKVSISTLETSKQGIDVFSHMDKESMTSGTRIKSDRIATPCFIYQLCLLIFNHCCINSPASRPNVHDSLSQSSVNAVLAWRGLRRSERLASIYKSRRRNGSLILWALWQWWRRAENFEVRKSAFVHYVAAVQTIRDSPCCS